MTDGQGSDRSLKHAVGGGGIPLSMRRPGIMRLARAPALAGISAGATQVAGRERVTVTGEGADRDAADPIERDVQIRPARS